MLKICTELIKSGKYNRALIDLRKLENDTPIWIEGLVTKQDLIQICETELSGHQGNRR